MAPLNQGIPPALLAIPLLFVAVAAIEGWYLQQVARTRYDWKAFFASLGDAVGRRLITRTIGLGTAAAILSAAARYRFTDIPMNGAVSWLALLIAQDFCYYWQHRADHRINWLWASHSVHHSSNQYNFAAAYRLGWTNKLSGGALFYLPLVLIGFPMPAVLLAIVINLFYQFWLHTELVPTLGPLEYVFNTPGHHRIHHAGNSEYLNRNYGGILIVFDRLFGTFAVEQPDAPCRYGLTTPLLSNNPLRIAFHGWLALVAKLRGARSMRVIGGALLGPPD